MRKTILVLFTALLTTTATAQPPDAIVGTWRLVSFLSPDSTGQQRPVWGEHPAGLIIYTSDGHVSAQLYDPRRPRLGDIANATPFAGAQAQYGGLYTYFGTFSVDGNAHTVSHHVEGAMAPDWVGSTLVRAYRFLGPDRLELRVVTDAAGRTVENGSMLVWERVRTGQAGLRPAKDETQ
jgi:Lipocalin-like domain